MTSPLYSSRLLLAAAAIAALIVALIAGAVGYGLASWTRHAPATASSSKAPTAATGERRVLYWFDPMNPAQHFDKPGKSPYMDMALTPKYADEAVDSGGSSIDPRRQQSLGMRLATVERTDFAAHIDAPATLEFNQRNIAVVQARAAGFVQRVYGRAPGDVVRRGAPIVDLLIPSWNGAAAEYLALAHQGDPALVAAARQRLRLLGMSDQAVAAIAKGGKAPAVITATAPTAGAIQTLDVRQGMAVTGGQTLAQIAGLSPIWLTVALPEVQAAQVRPGDEAAVEIQAYPGERFRGRVSAILPAAQADSRTVQARIELANPNGRLRPGMFATAHLTGRAAEALSVPAEAVIRTGKRSLVMTAEDGGRYAPVEVAIGRERDGRIEILRGLVEGQKVVSSGQFLLDSEASLAGLDAKKLPASSATAASPAVAKLVEGRGRIEALKADEITLSHEAIPALGWPAMTMGFPLSSAAIGKGFKPGDRVRFALEQTPDGPVVRRLERMESGR